MSIFKAVGLKEKGAFDKVAVHPLQSWEWGEFRSEWGNKVTRIGVYENNKLVDAAQVIFTKIPFSNFTIGTVIKGSKPTKKLLVQLKKLAREENVVFIKLEPSSPYVIARNKNTKRSQSMEERNVSFGMLKKYKSVIKLLKNNGCVTGKTLFTPTTFWIDLTKSEDELIKSLSSKTRYNIRLAHRKGVKVLEDNSDEAFEKYIELMRETVERQGFYAHTECYHRLMWKHLHTQLIDKNRKPIARLLTAKYKNEIISTWIVFVWHDFLYYPYGASSTKYKNVMANNLMMWEAILYGKKLGLKTFDLWGREEGKGFTKFKEGYNPQVVEFLGTWDLVTHPFYWPYRIAESIRWKFLRFKNNFTKASF